MTGALEKPVIAAVNGYAMGGGFMLVERTDLRVAAKGAVFEVSEAKRWLLGGYNHGHIANLPYPVAMEMALGFRFTAERFLRDRLSEPARRARQADGKRLRDGGASVDIAPGLARQHRAYDAAECGRCRPPSSSISRRPCTSTAPRAI